MAKPWVLEPAVPLELERIAYGGLVDFPYEALPPAKLGEAPRLKSLTPLSLAPGAPLPFRMILFGQACEAAGDVIRAVAEAPLTRKAAGAQGSFLLERVHDVGGSGRLLFDRQLPAIPVQPPTVRPLVEPTAQTVRVKGLRICWVTPLRLHLDEGYCYAPQQAAEHFPAACWARCVRIHEACSSAGARPPFAVLQPNGWWVEEAHAYRYQWTRQSLRQGREMSLDGLVGFCDLYGDLSYLYSLMRIAEIIHIGQKTTFGFGKIRVYILE